MEKLFEIFEELGYPYFRMGTMSPENYPDSFFIHWNTDTPNLTFRDNESKSYKEDVQIFFYTNDPNLIYSVLHDFIHKCKSKGIIVIGRGYDAQTDLPEYSGRSLRINIVHKED